MSRDGSASVYLQRTFEEERRKRGTGNNCRLLAVHVVFWSWPSRPQEEKEKRRKGERRGKGWPSPVLTRGLCGKKKERDRATSILLHVSLHAAEQRERKKGKGETTRSITGSAVISGEKRKRGRASSLMISLPLSDVEGGQEKKGGTDEACAIKNQEKRSKRSVASNRVLI